MAESFSKLVVSRFCRHKLALIAAFILAIFILAAVLAPIIESLLGVRHDLATLENVNLAPGWPHILGTNDVGQDLFARLIYGGRISLFVGIVSALASAIIGSFIGVLAGYYGGRVDALLMRFTDAMLSIPVLPLMIVFAAVDTKHFLGPISKLILIIVFFGWMTVARLARGASLQLREMEFVTAARALGASHARLICVHILPNALAPIIVATTLEVGSNILYEASLSFLGLGVEPPVSSWGNMLNNAMEYIKSSPGLAFWPGFFILLTVASFNFLGDGMRDALDPHQVMKRDL